MVNTFRKFFQIPEKKTNNEIMNISSTNNKIKNVQTHTIYIFMDDIEIKKLFNDYLINTNNNIVIEKKGDIINFSTKKITRIGNNTENSSINNSKSDEIKEAIKEKLKSINDNIIIYIKPLKLKGNIINKNKVNYIFLKNKKYNSENKLKSKKFFSFSFSKKKNDNDLKNKKDNFENNLKNKIKYFKSDDIFSEIVNIINKSPNSNKIKTNGNHNINSNSKTNINSNNSKTNSNNTCSINIKGINNNNNKLKIGYNIEDNTISKSKNIVKKIIESNKNNHTHNKLFSNISNKEKFVEYIHYIDLDANSFTDKNSLTSKFLNILNGKNLLNFQISTSLYLAVKTASSFMPNGKAKELIKNKFNNKYFTINSLYIYKRNKKIKDKNIVTYDNSELFYKSNNDIKNYSLILDKNFLKLQNNKTQKIIFINKSDIIHFIIINLDIISIILKKCVGYDFEI